MFHYCPKGVTSIENSEEKRSLKDVQKILLICPIHSISTANYSFRSNPYIFVTEEGYQLI